MHVVPALGKLRQKDHEFKASLEYIVSDWLTWAIGRLCFKQTHTHTHQWWMKWYQLYGINILKFKVYFSFFFSLYVYVSVCVCLFVCVNMGVQNFRCQSSIFTLFKAGSLCCFSTGDARLVGPWHPREPPVTIGALGLQIYLCVALRGFWELIPWSSCLNGRH